MALVVDVQFETAQWRKVWPRAAVETRQLLTKAHAFISAFPLEGEAGAPKARPTGNSSLSRLRRTSRGARLSSKGLEVSVVFASDERVRGLNARFRGKDRATNVLSFANPEAPLGGMALAFETVFREAKAQRKPFINHSKHLILHGFLHLTGHDHDNRRAARLMEGLEIAILSAMGIPNPYVLRSARA